MLIRKLTLNNFRQYFGKQEMKFSVNEDNNITVIHGENGAGKTALLNAFNWSLYGITDLPDPDKLVNSYAVESAPDARKVEMYVELEFESREVEYILKRSIVGTKYGSDLRNPEEQILLQYFSDGQWRKLSNPTNEINRILPQNLRNYFLFDGERIDHLSRHDDNDEIKEAVKVVMDLEIIDRGIKHTEDAKKDFHKEWANFADEETKQLLEQEERYKAEREELIGEESQLKNNIEYRNKQIKDIDDQLALVKGISEKQQERKQLEESLKTSKAELETVQTSLRKLVSKQGYLASTHILAGKIKSKFASETPQQEIFPGLTSDLVQSVLEKGTCICGEEVCNHHKENLQKLLASVSKYSQEATQSNLNTQMELVLDNRDRFISEIEDKQKSEYRLKEHIIDLQNKLEEISSELSNREYENVPDLESNRRKFLEDITNYQKSIGVIEHRTKELDLKIKEISGQISKQQQKQDKANLAKRRLDTCEKLTAVMQKIYNLKEEEVKTDLQEKIQEVYGNFLRKGFKISLTDDFKLVVQNHYGEKVALSQGERQITSLSFIGAIVDIARKHYQKKSSNLINEGGIYPLVMDSPFGALDSDHRHRVAQGIHKLSEQIIVIVSTSQWKGEVEESLKNHVGHQYILNYHDPRQDVEETHEYTEIKRL
ncbi:AAA family ATPase [Pontibacillus salipaludis]|uniref:Nuclease SbcCD subunit C n=1 Tax=Pontibacillus salipaludis TaxID=1697394 RepID=A0ABQ1Q0K6_9BACI|nr:AAA family ATPase [Pontibacillus salipaludis]GGD08293.1 hypothetical protein GCM10011389_14820 [Pontibacillus salipaludis]